MEYEMRKVCRAECVRCEGVTVARARAELWERGGAGEASGIEGFYREATKRYLAYVREDYGARARTAYEASEEANKRFYFATFETSLSCRWAWVGSEILSVCLTRREWRRGEESLCRLYAQTWHLPSERMIPLAVLLRHAKLDRRTARTARRADGYYLADGELHFFRHTKEGEVTETVLALDRGMTFGGSL